MLPDGTVRATHLWKRFRADRPPRKFLDMFEQLPAKFSRAEDRPQRWRWALRDIDFAIEPGESVGLIGTNGSGKSTLAEDPQPDHVPVRRQRSTSSAASVH